MGRLIPVSPYDAEMMVEFPNGTMFDLFERRRRSNPQLRLYWKILHTVVKSTGRWPRARNLHNDIKLTLGYVTMSYDLKTRKVIRTPDSTGLDEMNQSDFNVYFERAMNLISSEVGVDPMVLLEESAR